MKKLLRDAGYLKSGRNVTDALGGEFFVHVNAGTPSFMVDKKEAPTVFLQVKLDSDYVTWVKGARVMKEAVKYETKGSGPAFIELFAGIGGFRCALDSLGAKCVFASELSSEAQETYAANFGDKPHGDINEIDATLIPDHEILTAGFPCQSFSQAGQQKGLSDGNGRLFFEIIRVAKAHRPKALLLENVSNLLTLDGGQHWECIKAHLGDAGYFVHHKIINAVNYVPQNRPRLYIVCLSKALANGDTFEWPEEPKCTETVRDILENLESYDEHTLTEH